MEYVYDEPNDSLYIYKMKGELKETRRICDDVYIDYNEEGEIYGIEILDLHRKQETGLSHDEIVKILAS